MNRRRILWTLGIPFLFLWVAHFFQWVKPKGQLRSTGAGSTPSSIEKRSASYDKLPLSFVPNEGLTDNVVKYFSRGRGYTLLLAGDELTLKLSGNRPQAKAQAPLASHRLPAYSHGLLSIHSIWPEVPGSGLPASDNSPGTANSALRLRLVGASRDASPTGEEELPGKANYFIGNDPKQWRTNLPTYGRVRYRHVYPGIDLVCYGNQGGQLEYDFIVAPGANPKTIHLRVESAYRQSESGRWGSGRRNSKPEIAGNGDLVVRTNGGEVRFRKPVAYQPGSSKQVSGDSELTIRKARLPEVRYLITPDEEIRFELSNYDQSRPLVIDPVLAYSTYLGGSSFDSGTGIAVDSFGAGYVTGQTSSLDFPTSGRLQSDCDDCSDQSFDAFVAKLSPTGSALVYSSYLGGSGNDQGTGIALDMAGSAYVTGYTTSMDFPVTPGALQTTVSSGPTEACSVWSPCDHAFVSKLSADGSTLVYSTYLGGNAWDTANAIAVDSSGNAYVTGGAYTANFPTTTPLQAGEGIYVFKLNAAGSAPIYSTTLGGDSAINAPEGGATPTAYGIAVDSSGSAYVTGFTYSTTFPVTAGAFQTTAGPPCGYAPGPIACAHAYVFKLNAAGTALVYSTYLRGSSYDYGYGIALDSSLNAYITGSTTSLDFPTLNAFQTVNEGFLGTAFISKLNAAGSDLVYSTYLGGTSTDSGYAIAVDSFGSAYATGMAQSTDFPTLNAIQATCTTDSYLNPAAFVTELNASGSAPIFSTYLGCSNEMPAGNSSDGAIGQSIAVDSGGGVYTTGWTGASDFPVANPLQATLRGKHKFICDEDCVQIGGALGGLLAFQSYICRPGA
jgi:Beta-propeller repeat